MKKAVDEVSQPLLKVSNVSKTYDHSSDTVKVLKDVNLEMNRGESLSIMGPSGSGKSTLLQVVGTLDAPSSGIVEINEQVPQTLQGNDLARFRNKTVGFVFQDHHLLPHFSVFENVLVPVFAFHKVNDVYRRRAEYLLSRVGLSHRLAHRPSELSGGERQRVSIARALIMTPLLLLCDEPTGNLDAKTASEVTDLIMELHHDENNCLIIATHSERLAARCARQVALGQGELVGALVG